MMKNYFLLIMLFLIKPAFAQNPIGLQQVANFASSEYKGGNQNWHIQQDQFGMMYFANNEGLLSYNGQTWRLYSIPSKTVVRSIQIDADGKIFIGAQDDIGYFFPNQTGNLVYKSLKGLIPKPFSSFTDVWNIELFNHEVFFRTNEKIFEYNYQSVKAFESGTGWMFMGKCHNQLFGQQRATGLMEFTAGNWKKISTLPENLLITSILDYDDNTFLITTLVDGLYLLHNHTLSKLSTPIDNIIKIDRINTAISLNPDLYAIGTAFGGCLVIDHHGKLIQNFSNTQALQKNYIRSLYADKNQNIWLGLDDGISFIAYNASIKQIYPDVNKQSSTYAVKVFKNTLYIGTSDAVFKLPVQPNTHDLSYCTGSFEEVSQTKGQVWNLNEIADHLLLGNEDGAFLLKGDTFVPLYNYPATWIFKPLTNGQPANDIIAGTYNGLHLLNYAAGKFKDICQLDGLRESLRFITVDFGHNIVWSSHPYRGVYKITLSADHRKIVKSVLYTDKSGLPSALHNYVFKINDRNIVATQNGVYEYNPKTDRFYLSDYFFQMFGHAEIQYMNQDNQGNIWFIGNKKVGVIDFNKGNSRRPYAIVYFPELTSKVLAGFENIYSFDKNNVFIGSNRGVFHINYEKYQKNIRPVNILLNQVKIIGDKDSVIFGGYFVGDHSLKVSQDKSAVLKLPHNFNSFHFEYSSTLFEQASNIEFSYQLIGFDPKWSVWSSRSEKEYTNLSYGTYTFVVKARNNLGNESDLMSYSFEIRPAWYQTYWSDAVYICILAGFIYGIVIYQKRKHRKAELHLKYLHQLELDHNEKEIISLKNAKLEDEVSFKNKELATTTMHLVQRGKLLSKIKDGLLLIQDVEPANQPQELNKVLKLIADAERSDADWDHFAVHFDQVHSNFLATLKSKFPDLSATDLKICAYLKMNLTSKEIAQLMSVTIGAVEVSRYRLRKKLKLPSNVNLFDYLVKATSQTL